MSRLSQRILQKVGDTGMEMARREMGSETLRRAIRYEVLTALSSRFFVPHYWAIYHHDGHGRINPRTAPKLIWFADPKNDPRIEGGRPERLSDVSRLTGAQYDEGQRKNHEMFLANPAGGHEQWMFVRDSSGPVRASRRYPFFTTGMRGFPKFFHETVVTELQEEMLMLAVSETSVATLRF